MNNSNIKKLGLLLLFFFVAGCICIYAQPSLDGVANATKGWTASIKTICTWLMSIASIVGGVVVAFKLFSAKPDARDGIMYWVGGLIFCAAVAIVLATM